MMMMLLQILCMMLYALPAMLQAKFELFDLGHTVISGPVSDVMITYCDVYEKRSLDGQIIPLKEQIKMIIIGQQVLLEKMPIDDSATEKYIANIKKDHNLTDDDLEDLAMQCGRTLAEVKQLLNSQYMRDFFLYHKFRSHLVPTDQEIEEYCQEHPEVEPGYCTIQVAFVDYTESNKQEIQSIVDSVVSGACVDHVMINWTDPIQVGIDNIADDKLFIKDLSIDQIAVIDDKLVFELYKLVDKQDERMVPVESRKAMVIDILNRQMYEDLLTNYEQHIYDDVAVINLM